MALPPDERRDRAKIIIASSGTPTKNCPRLRRRCLHRESIRNFLELTLEIFGPTQQVGKSRGYVTEDARRLRFRGELVSLAGHAEYVRDQTPVLVNERLRIMGRIHCGL